MFLEYISINDKMVTIGEILQNYLNPDFSITNGHHNARISGKLDSYEKEGIDLISKGLIYPQIHDIIYKKRYTGNVVNKKYVDAK